MKLTLHGAVPQDVVSSLLSDADLFVLASRIEGHPKALLEAMAAGLPCIGTDVPGIGEVLRDGVNGLVVGEDTTDLRRGIETLLDDRALASRLGHEARRRVESHYNLERTLAAEIEVLKEIAGRDDE